MKRVQFEFDYFEFDSIEELNRLDQKLVQASVSACEKAYAPYSKFRVGASILLEDGEIVTGSNQENASLNCGICAERNVLFAAAHNHKGKVIDTICISAKNSQGLTKNAITPCGLCRQSILELELQQKPNIKIILNGEDKLLVFNSIKSLLPFHFEL